MNNEKSPLLLIPFNERALILSFDDVLSFSSFLKYVFDIEYSDYLKKIKFFSEELFS